MIKELFLMKKNNYSVLWILFHTGIFLTLLISIFTGVSHGIDTNLFDILPESASIRNISTADKKLGQITGRSFTILCRAQTFSSAKNGAERLYTTLKNSPEFDSLDFLVDTSVISQITDFIYVNRYKFLDDKTIKQLMVPGGPQNFAENALAQVYSPFSITSLKYLDSDPFMLTEHITKNMLTAILSSGTDLSLKENVLASYYQNNWYVLLRGSLSAEGSSVTNKHSGIQKIYNSCNLLEKQKPAITFIYSGIPFHSFESSSSAQKEIFLITTLSILIVILLFIAVFRSPLPVVFSVAAVLISAGTALCSTLLIFRHIHILTFVFGTTLIGTCLDYSIHFFVHRYKNQGLKTGTQIRSFLIKGLTMSLISTEICYAALIFAPFELLKQVAVFSFTGIMSSYLTTICIYPLLPPYTGKIKSSKISYKKIPEKLLLTPKKRKAIFVIILACAASLLFFSRTRVKIDNNISALYKMTGHLLDDEKISAKVINYGSTGWYYIISGQTESELLENERKLTKLLDDETTTGNLGTYLSLTKFIPSPSQQKKSQKSAAKFIPLVGEQCSALGLPEKTAASLAEALKTVSTGNDFSAVLPDGTIPPYLKKLFSSLWIGKIGGLYYSAVIPLHAENEQIFRHIADTHENVFFINKVKDISTRLDALTKNMIILFIASYFVILILLKFFYNWHDTIKIISIPFIVVVMTIAVLARCAIPLSFFSITGIVLVFGLGLDYIIYTIENIHRKDSDRLSSRLTKISITLSFLTTAVSFGALGISTFVPVHIFGLTIFTGLATAYVCASLLDI
jgi:predicted exporter